MAIDQDAITKQIRAIKKPYIKISIGIANIEVATTSNHFVFDTTSSSTYAFAIDLTSPINAMMFFSFCPILTDELYNHYIHR